MENHILKQVDGNLLSTEFNSVQYSVYMQVRTIMLFCLPVTRSVVLSRLLPTENRFTGKGRNGNIADIPVHPFTYEYL